MLKFANKLELGDAWCAFVATMRVATPAPRIGEVAGALMPKVPPLVRNPLGEAIKGTQLGETIRSTRPVPLGEAIGSTQAVARPIEPLPYTVAELTAVKSQAKSMYERVVRSIAEFEEDRNTDRAQRARSADPCNTLPRRRPHGPAARGGSMNILKPDEEIGARLVSFGQGEVIHVLDVDYRGPDLITFEGTNADGRPVLLLQHISQVNVLLVALPIEKARSQQWCHQPPLRVRRGRRCGYPCRARSARTGSRAPRSAALARGGRGA